MLTIPAIIDEQTFQAAQRSLQHHRGIATRNRKHDYLFLGGRLRCGRCGRHMTGACWKPATRYCHCNSQHHVMDPSLPCPGYFRADVVELQVWAAVVRVLEQPEVIAAEVTSQQVNANEQR